MNKHTPGPWIGRMYQSGFYLVRGPEGDEGGSILEGGLVLADDEENEANARLIAAAPDLLASLKAYMKAVSGVQQAIEDGLNVQGALSAIIAAEEDAIDAIAKAQP